MSTIWRIALAYRTVNEWEVQRMRLLRPTEVIEPIQTKHTWTPSINRSWPGMWVKTWSAFGQGREHLWIKWRYTSRSFTHSQALPNQPGSELMHLQSMFPLFFLSLWVHKILYVQHFTWNHLTCMKYGPKSIFGGNFYVCSKWCVHANAHSLEGSLSTVPTRATPHDPC